MSDGTTGFYGISPMYEMNISSLLLSNWRFKRDDGSVIADNISFDPRHSLFEGTIAGYRHPNEDSWRIRDGVLEFLNESGEATTRFEAASKSMDGVQFLRGRVVFARGRWHILEELPAAERKPANVAVFVRTHVVNAKVIDLLKILARGTGYDLYIAADSSLVDGTAGPLTLRGPNVVPHSLKQFREMEVSLNHQNPFWWFGDYTFYCSYLQKPDYDYYIFIEFDVHLVKGDPSFIEKLVERINAEDGAPSFDLIAPGLSVSQNPNPWHGPWPEGVPWRWALQSFVVFSRRALVYLYDARKKWAVGAPPALEQWYGEAFVPSVLAMDERFKCVNLTDLMPHCCQPGYYTGSALPSLLGSKFESDPPMELVHPVFSAPEFLEKHFRHAVDTDRVADFISETLMNPALPIPEELRGAYLLAAESRLSVKVRRAQRRKLPRRFNLQPSTRPAIIEELLAQLYKGISPFDAAQQEWIDTGYPHTFIPTDLIEAVLSMTKQTFWLEVGSMVGGSAIRTADVIQKLGSDTAIVCIDPFIGDVNAWSWETKPPPGWTWQCLRLEDGRPTIFKRFLANVAAAGHHCRILPLPVTSSVGIRLLQRLHREERISSLPEVVYLDSAHEEGETFLELSYAWDILPPGGILMGDDWGWAAVAHDVTKFSETITVDAERAKLLMGALPEATAVGGIICYTGQWVLTK
jgi:hypothetical protein